MILFLLDLYESFLMNVFLWAGGKLYPVVDLYAPGEDVKAVIFADSDATLNAILRGWTNPDAEP